MYPFLAFMLFLSHFTYTCLKKPQYIAISVYMVIFQRNACNTWNIFYIYLCSYHFQCSSSFLYSHLVSFPFTWRTSFSGGLLVIWRSLFHLHFWLVLTWYIFVHSFIFMIPVSYLKWDAIDSILMDYMFSFSFFFLFTLPISLNWCF